MSKKNRAAAVISDVIYRDFPVIQQAIKDGDKDKALQALATAQTNLSAAASAVRNIEEAD